MARALIVGCGCRGRELGRRLLDEGWAVRGTSRREDGLAAIEAAGIEPALADPDRVGTVLELVADVAVVVLLLGGAPGGEDCLERLIEHLVETPVRGILYEGTPAGEQVVLTAGRTWRIPVGIISDETDLREAVKAVLASRQA